MVGPGLSELHRMPMYIPWNYWQVEYLAISLNNTIGEILNWWILVLYGEKSMLAV